MLFDTHAHLNFEAFEDDFEKVIDRSRQRNIAIIIPSSNLENSKRAIEIAEAYDTGVYAAVGLHPLHALDENFDISTYRNLVSHPKVVALGEVGLDYFRIPAGNRSEIERQQKKVLNGFLGLSQELRLPLILHCRDAHKDLIKALTEFDRASKGFDTRGVIHCFSGNFEDALRYFNLDFLVSFTGFITHAHFQGEIIAKSPIEKILVETDSPYCSPEPFRTCRNEPVNVELIAREIARLKEISYEQVEEITTNNALSIFSKIGKLLPPHQNFWCGGEPELQPKIPWRVKGARSARKVFLRAKK